MQICGLLTAALFATIGVATISPAGASPGSADDPVRVENSLPGTSAWRIPQAPRGSIEGYASGVSVLPGQTLPLHVSTAPGARYRVEVFRLGWYGGQGGRLLGCLPSCTGDESGAPRSTPPFDPATGYLDAGWPVTDEIRVGRNWVSGYFVADLMLTSGQSAGRGGWVPFVVHGPPQQQSAILVQAAVNTWQAYNRWGGMSLYKDPGGRSCKRICTRVSFDRPYDPETQNLWDFELPLVRFLEERGYDVSYTTDVDTDRNPGELLLHRLVIAAGHDEYWTKTIRDAFERARALGTNLAFTGANTGYWQMRYADDRRTIVEYRIADLDPESDPALKTMRFRALGRPECELEGVQYTTAGGGTESIGGPFDYGVDASSLGDPWLAGSGFTASATLPHLVGYEWDGLTPGCRTPPVTDLFHFPGPPAADAVRYTAASGARVFSAGTLNFSHGLDDFQRHPGVPPTGDPRLERFMENALADLTRPAPPTAARAAVVGSGVRIAIKRRPDPRVQAIVVYRGRKLVCARLRTVCVDHRPPRGGQFHYTVVVRDRWSTSLPLDSNNVDTS